MGKGAANERSATGGSWRKPGAMAARFGAAIETLKDARGMQWTQLGEQLGQSESTLHRIKRGDVSISWEMLEAFAEVFGCPVETLLVLAGAVSLELADDELTAVVAGVLQVPLQVQSSRPEDAIAGDPELDEQAKRMLLQMLAAQRKMRRRP
jgi:transcriptional regulator with XRE-family HTH domain